MGALATATEQQLHVLCRRSFLSFWTFPNPFRRIGGMAKELCDALVVCGPYVVAFSDKSISFPQGPETVGWERWYKRSVLSSAKQLLGAYRYLREPEPALYLDSSLSTPLRCDLPAANCREIHLVAVANCGTKPCSQLRGGQIGTV